jgi:hypothetical protein
MLVNNFPIGGNDFGFLFGRKRRRDDLLFGFVFRWDLGCEWMLSFPGLLNCLCQPE